MPILLMYPRLGITVCWECRPCLRSLLISNTNAPEHTMHFFTLSAVAVAALAFLATPDVAAAMPVADLAARSAELDTRSAQPEARRPDMLCQVAGIRGCTFKVRRWCLRLTTFGISLTCL